MEELGVLEASERALLTALGTGSQDLWVVWVLGKSEDAQRGCSARMQHEVEWSGHSPMSPGDNVVLSCLVRCQPLWVPQLLHQLHSSPNARSIQNMEKSAQ